MADGPHPAKAYAKRRNAMVNDALGNRGKDSDMAESLKEHAPGLAGPVSAVAVRYEAQADTLAAEMHDAMPWMGSSTESVWHWLRRSEKVGTPVCVGSPGISKTSWAHRLADILRIPPVDLDASKGPASFSLLPDGQRHQPVEVRPGQIRP